MNEMTLEGLLREGNSDYAKEDAKFMIIEVQVGDGFPETIINPYPNFSLKLKYYSEAYNQDLTLKANPNIKIVYYSFVDDTTDYFA